MPRGTGCSGQRSTGGRAGAAVRWRPPDYCTFCENLYAKDEEVLTEESHALEPPKMRRQASLASVNSQTSQTDSAVTSEDGAPVAE